MSQHRDPLEPTNVQRAQWAKAALTVFTAETYSGDHPDTMDSGDLETAISDLICDLLHFARFHPTMDAAEIHARALRTFEQEIAEEANCDCPDRSWYGPYHDTQCPAGIAAEASKRERLSAGDLLEALEIAHLVTEPEENNSGSESGRLLNRPLEDRAQACRRSR
jgi:hypothetical protein